MVDQKVFGLFLFFLAFTEMEGFNLAFRKPTWQSQTFLNFSSDKAVDGRFRTYSIQENECAVSGENAEDVTWYVDLETIQSIHSVSIIYRTDGLEWRISPFPSTFLGFFLYVSNTTRRNDRVLYYHDDHYTDKTIPSIVTITKPVQARYVTYYNTRKGDLSTKPGYSAKASFGLCEVFVRGCPVGYHGESCTYRCPMNCRHCHLITGECIDGCTLGFEGHRCKQNTRENLAKFHPTSSSPDYGFSFMGSGRAVDGRKTDLSAFGGQCFISKIDRPYVLWRVDLTNIRSIERIVIYYRTDNVKWGAFANRFKGFSLIISNSTNHRDGVTCYKDDRFTKTTVHPVFEITCSGVGRHVIYYNERLPEYGSRPGYSQYAFADLCEVEVYGCPSHGYYGPHCKVPCMSVCKNHLENVAFVKPTWHSNGMLSSDKAVDGRYTNLHYNGGQCTMSGYSQTATWWVNLERDVAIDHVLIYLRTDNLPLGSNNDITGHHLGFFLYISNTTSRYKGVLCFRDTNFTTDTIPAVLNISCPYVGQYVIFYNERLPGISYPSDYSQFTFTALCEVEVYGCPSPFENLPQCFSPCPENCKECYPDSGACKKCRPGFHGLGCEFTCHAIANVSLWPSISALGKPSSYFQSIFTEEGLKLQAPKDGSSLAILMDLPMDYMEIANVSFFIDHAEHLMIDLIAPAKTPQRYEYTDQYVRTSKKKFTVYNDRNTIPFRVRITVRSKYDFTISNVVLHLRDCVKIKYVITFLLLFLLPLWMYILPNQHVIIADEKLPL